MFKIANDEAPNVRIIRPDLSEALANVVALSMSKSPESRYQTGEQFAQNLRAVLVDLDASVLVSPTLPYSSMVPTPASEKTVAFASTVPNMKAQSPNVPPSTDLEI
jgi:hypothetical protein